MVRGVRTSFTFRRVRNRPCLCAWPRECDSQASTVPPTRKQQEALLRDTGGATAAEAGERQAIDSEVITTCASGEQHANRAGGVATCTSAADANPANGGPVDTARTSAAAPVEQRLNSAFCASAAGAEVWQSDGAGGNMPCASAAGAEEQQASSEAAVSGTEQEDRKVNGFERNEAECRWLEEEHVHRVYNAIGSHFSATRFAIWPEVKRFIIELPAGAVVADVGCGNGKYFAVRRDIAVLGSDRSSALVDTAMMGLRNTQANTPAPAADVLLADGMTLPFRRACMDAVLCIAVLHHISSPARRLGFLAELRDLLKPGCAALITVWATEQEDPAKTVDKWTPLGRDKAHSNGAREPNHGSGDDLAGGGDFARGSEDECGAVPRTGDGLGCQGAGVTPCEGTPISRVGTAGSMHSWQTASVGGSGSGTDYFVPWQVPFHRAGLSRRAVSDSPYCRECKATKRFCDDNDLARASLQVPVGTGAEGGGGLAQEAFKPSQDALPAEGDVNEEKKTIVYKRYYHLFSAGELEGLIHGLPGVRLRYSKYDASNWVVVFERTVLSDCRPVHGLAVL